MEVVITQCMLGQIHPNEVSQRYLWLKAKLVSALSTQSGEIPEDKFLLLSGVSILDLFDFKFSNSM